MLVGAEEREHLHVSRVRSGAVGGLGGQVAAAHDLRERCVFQVGQAGAPFGMGMEEVPQPAGLGFLLQVVDDRRLKVRVTGLTHLLFVDRFGRVNVLVHEIEQFGLVLLGAIRELKH